MNSRERVLTALNHKEPDRIPLDLGGGTCCMFTKGFYLNLLKYLGMEDPHIVFNSIAGQTVIPTDEVLEKVGTDIRYGLAKISKPGKNDIQKYWEDEKNMYYRDNWGIDYRMPKIPGYYYDMISHPMEDTKPEEDVNIHWPDFPEFDRKATVAHNKSIVDRGFLNEFAHYYSLGIYESGPRIYGFEYWLQMLALDPDRVTRYLTEMIDRKIEWWRQIFDICGDYIDVVCELDDVATQNSTWISPEMYRKLIFPHHKRLFQAIKKMKPGVKIFYHCCGAVRPLIPDLIEAGIDILNPVQTSAKGMDPYELKKEFGKDITFWGGGINTQYVLPHGTKQEIIDDVKRNIDAFAPGGGFVFSTIHSVQPDVPPENFMLMRDTFLKYANY